MAGIPSRMNQSAREQILSTDLNRIGTLAGRELMDAAQSRSVRADFYDPASGTFDDFGAGAKGTNSQPLSGTTQPPSLDGIAGVFDMDLGAGEGVLPATPANPDISGYQLLRWPAQTISWPGGGTPDATHPVICTVVATPGDQLADITSRNILLDPSLRTVAPQNVYKTSNPLATISVIAGTAATAPVPPTIPAGTLALFDVFVPPAVADSTAFLPVRRAWRVIEFPGTSQHGILHGCEPKLVLASAVLPLGNAVVHRLVIDGELLTFQGTGQAIVENDTASPPTNAPPGNDKPYYLYLCGGRHQPMMNYGPVALGGTPIPVHLVLSATAPDPLGYPKATLAIASPATAFPRAACVYIGLAFYGAGTGTNVRAYYDGDWIRGAVTQVATLQATVTNGFKETPISTPEVSYTAWTLGSLPAVSPVVELFIAYAGSSSGDLASVSCGGGSDSFAIAQLGDEFQQRLVRISGAQAATIYYKGVATGILSITPTAYKMNVPRLAR